MHLYIGSALLREVDLVGATLIELGRASGPGFPTSSHVSRLVIRRPTPTARFLQYLQRGGCPAGWPACPATSQAVNHEV